MPSVPAASIALISGEGDQYRILGIAHVEAEILAFEEGLPEGSTGGSHQGAIALQVASEQGSQEAMAQHETFAIMREPEACGALLFHGIEQVDEFVSTWPQTLQSRVPEVHFTVGQC